MRQIRYGTTDARRRAQSPGQVKLPTVRECLESARVVRVVYVCKYATSDDMGYRSA